LAGKRVCGRYCDEIASATDDDCGFEWQSSFQFREEFSLTRRLSDNKRSRRANTHRVEAL
jgi:hypothetical protein